MSYYVRVATRGSAKTGSPRQALNYITDAHDARRDPSYSDAELHYIARMDPGWKTDLEGGRVPLVGFGELAGQLDEQQLAATFEHSCQPYHDIRGTTGYKSITLTVPKEVSLYAEGHREEAKAAINAAIKHALDRAFPGFRYSAVAAIHTRNQAGEIHYHAHVLVGKFAQKVATGRTYSLGSKAGGETGRARLRDLKAGWQEGIEKEFRERLNLGIEQKTPRSPVALLLPDGTRLDPLNRESRRLLEKELCPTFTETTPSGAAVTRHFRWSAMDDRIFEIASGARGTSSWSLTSFKEVFPEQARYVSRYETRVRSLQAIGYLSPEGKITPAFRVHFAAHHGVLTPELQRVRIDLLQRLARDKQPAAHPSQFWSQLQRYASLLKRVERLGYSRDEITTIFARADARKPTPQNLQRIRAEAERRAALAPAPTGPPKTKTIIRAYVDLQKSKLQRIYIITSGIVQFWKLREKYALAIRIKKVAERDLFYAKERRLAQVGRVLRPVLWLVRIAMPREARRLDKAVTRCARLAKQQQVWKAGRAEVQRAYEQWRKEFIQKPRAELAKQREALALPAQQAERPKVERARERIRLPDPASPAAAFRLGYQALAANPGKESGAVDLLRPWVGREEQLVVELHRRTQGEPTKLSTQEYAAAIRIGQVGNLLSQAEALKPPRVPAPFEDHKDDIQKLSVRLRSFRLLDPFSPRSISAFAPAQLRALLATARKDGLLDDGPGWALKGAAARALSQDIGRQLDQNRTVERGLEDRLQRRGKPQ
jgi:hypothetical protein